MLLLFILISLVFHLSIYEIYCSFENGALRSHGLSPFLVLYVQRVVFLVLLHSACPTRAIPCRSSLFVSNSCYRLSFLTVCPTRGIRCLSSLCVYRLSWYRLSFLTLCPAGGIPCLYPIRVYDTWQFCSFVTLCFKRVVLLVIRHSLGRTRGVACNSSMRFQYVIRIMCLSAVRV